MQITEKKLKLYDRVLATVSAIAIVAGGIWTLTGYFNLKNQDNALRKQEIRLEIFNDKKTIYYELADAEAEIAACNTYDEVLTAQKHFKRLYYGKAHIIAALDKAVNNQKVDFNTILVKYIRTRPDTSVFKYFGPSSLKLADLCRQNLKIDSVYK